MRSSRKIVAVALLVLVIGVPVYAGGMDTPKALCASTTSPGAPAVGGKDNPPTQNNWGVSASLAVAPDPLVSIALGMIQSVLALV